MYDNEFFVVDMTSCTSTGEIVNNLSLALETLNHSNKKIVLKLNDTKLNQPQLLSIQSLITSYGCTLDTVETTNDNTKSVASGMNIIVQEPIEKRVEEPIKTNENQDFEPFEMKTESIVKEVNGLHFEADLDVIQKQQNEIDISKDLKDVGISPVDDFQTVDEKAKEAFVQDNVIEEVNDYSKMLNENALTSTQENVEAQEEKDSKKAIGVYKKAYDENKIADDWEEVDFNEEATDAPVVQDNKITTYITQTLRSGQIVESAGNVVIIGDCHPGSEIRATGDITVWGVLSGIAHAGYNGNNDAKVRALKLNAVQLRIGDCYSRRPDSSNIPYIIRSSVFTPEEARVVNNEIMLFKINQN